MAGSLYKYLEPRWAVPFVEEGRIRFSSLAWFQNYEDDEERGDEFEGVRKYFAGKATRANEPSGPVMLPHHTFQAAAKARDHIFVLCVSRRLSVKLAERFKSPGTAITCVEIYDADVFLERLASTLKKQSPVQRQSLFREDVTYYSIDDPPGTNWALPKKLATHKGLRFADQEEHRFVFASKRHAFDPYRVDTWLVGDGAARRARPKLAAINHCRDLALGPLFDCCRTIELQSATAETPSRPTGHLFEQQSGVDLELAGILKDRRAP